MIVETPISFIKSDPKKGANQVGIGRVTLASIGGEMLTLKIILYHLLGENIETENKVLF